VWACGVIFLSFLAQRHPIFSLNNSSKIKNFTISNLIPMVCLFGSNNIKEIAFKYGYGGMIPDEMQKEKIPWDQICKINDPAAHDLLNRMLELDHSKRISAADSMNHKFFDSIRTNESQMAAGGAVGTNAAPIGLMSAGSNNTMSMQQTP
jgi:serine/threonine protein kinase